PNHPKIPCLSLPDFVRSPGFKDFRPAGVEPRLRDSVGGFFRMKYRYVLLSGILSLLFAGSVLARDITRQELLNFDNFLDSHPAIERDLQKDPLLLKNAAYISAHPELRTFLASNPGIRDSRE